MAKRKIKVEIFKLMGVFELYDAEKWLERRKNKKQIYFVRVK